MSISFPHIRKLLLFVLLNVADLVLTWCLIQRGNGEVYESNPVAAWWLHHHGWLGLAGFKMTVVLGAGAVLAFACVSRPRTGGRALTLGCALVAAVVLYSTYLAGITRMRAAEIARVKKHTANLERELTRCRTYRRLSERLGNDLVTRRCTLDEAVHRLAATSKARDPRLLRALRQSYPGCSDEACLAASLIEDAVTCGSLRPEAARRITDRLEADFRARFAMPFPVRCQTAPTPPGPIAQPGRHPLTANAG